MQRDPKGLLLLTVCSLTNLANEIYPTALFIQLGEQKMSISIAEKRLKVNK